MRRPPVEDNLLAANKIGGTRRRYPTVKNQVVPKRIFRRASIIPLSAPPSIIAVLPPSGTPATNGLEVVLPDAGLVFGGWLR